METSRARTYTDISEYIEYGTVLDVLVHAVETLLRTVHVVGRAARNGRYTSNGARACVSSAHSTCERPTHITAKRCDCLAKRKVL